MAETSAKAVRIIAEYQSQPWVKKANALVYALCQKSYMQANYKNGKKYKKHVPYSVPQEAQDLLDCIQRDDEEGAKAMFLYNYAIEKLDS